MNAIRILLTASIVSAPLLACTSGDDDGVEYVQANNPVETDLGWFTLELEPAPGNPWPQYIGPTDLAIHVDVGPDPLPSDPEVSGAKALQPPFVLTFGEAHPWGEPDGPTTITDTPEPVTPDGYKWVATFDFKVPGRWVIPVTITDFTNRSDSVELVFNIE